MSSDANKRLVRRFIIVRTADLDKSADLTLDWINAIARDLAGQATGLSPLKSPADILIIAVSTVKRHINNIYGKLAVQSRTQAIMRARELNLL